VIPGLSSIFQAILCAIENLALSILAVLVMGLNAFVVAIGGVVAALLLLLPNMPDHPPAMDSGVLGWLNWIVPIGGVLSVWTIVLSLWLAFLVLRIALRWMRAM